MSAHARDDRAAGVARRRGGGALPVLIDVKYAHVSNSPRRARSVGAVDARRARASRRPRRRTIRGETPRLSTLMPRKRPAARARRSLRAARCAMRQPDRAPAVARRDVVVRVVDRLEPRLRLGAERRVLDVLGAPAGGREEVGDDRLALVGDDLAARSPATAALVAGRLDARRRRRPASACRRSGRSRRRPCAVVIA